MGGIRTPSPRPRASEPLGLIWRGRGPQTDSLSLDGLVPDSGGKGPGPWQVPPWKCPVSVSSWAVFLGLERGLDPEPGSLTSGGSPLLLCPRWVPGGHTLSGAASSPPASPPALCGVPAVPPPPSDPSSGSALCKDSVSVVEIPSGAHLGAPRRPGPGVQPRGCLTLSADGGHCQGWARPHGELGCRFHASRGARLCLSLKPP